MRQHQGAHPRMGAVDVIPFVPLADVAMTDSVAAARDLGRCLGSELDIPVYLCEEAASRPERKNMAGVRQGECEGLFREMADPAWNPDFGPARPHPKAAAAAVGARIYLLAYNVNLGTAEIEITRSPSWLRPRAVTCNWLASGVIRFWKVGCGSKMKQVPSSRVA